MPSHLTDIFHLVLEASWQSSLVILLILLVRSFMGSLVPARWRHLLWLLALIRLLVPVSSLPPSQVSLQNIPAVNHPLEEINFTTGATAVAPAAEEAARPVRQGPEVSPSLIGASSDSGTAPLHLRKVDWRFLCALIWLVGVTVSLALTISAHLFLRRRLRKNCPPLDPTVTAIWDGCCRRLRIKHGPTLCMSEEVTSPALVGLLHPLLLLPEKNFASFSQADWENVFVHELAHYRRADHWANALLLLARTVHWFNPVVWIGFRLLRADRELAADEWALEHLAPGQAAAYGETLLKVLAQTSTRSADMVSVGILENRLELKQRLHRIMGFGSTTFAGSIIGVSLIMGSAVLVLGNSVNPINSVNPDTYLYMSPEEMLVKAATIGDQLTMDRMLAQGVDINTVLPTSKVFDIMMYQTPLSAAAGANQLDSLKYLLERGADINKNSFFTLPSPVISAMQLGRVEAANFLLTKGAVYDPVALAVFKNDLPALHSFLATQPGNVEQINVLCRIAAANGNLEEYTLLSDYAMGLPGQSDWKLDDETILPVMALGRRDIIAKVIEQEKRRNNVLNQNSVMRIGWAAAQGDMRDWLIAQGVKLSEYTDGERLIDAADRQDIPTMERLLSSGVNINYSGESSWTPLTKASAWNRIRSVKFLLAHGADPNSLHLNHYSSIGLTETPAIDDLLLAAGGKINPDEFSYAVVFGPPGKVRWFLDHGINLKTLPSNNQGDTPLFDARDPEIVGMLIAQGIEVNAHNKSGRTALFSVCEWSTSSSTVLTLLDHGADANAKDNYGTTPIMVARTGAVVDALVQHGADLAVKDREGKNILQFMPYHADSTRFEALLRHGVPFDPKVDGPTLMLFAARSGESDVIKMLLDKHVDPNVPGVFTVRQGKPITQEPLAFAVISDNVVAAQLLIDHGAKISDAAMNTAMFNHHPEMMKLFYEHGAKMISPLAYAVSQNQSIDQLKKIIESGSPADSSQDKLMTPLGLAASLGYLNIVQFLVESGADVNGFGSGSAGAAQLTPLHLAAAEGRDEIVTYLLQHGAKPTIDGLMSAASEATPYREQLSSDHFEKTVKLFIEAGVLKGVSEETGAEVLQSALFTRQGPGNLNVVKMLVEAGLSPEAHFKDGKTVMQMFRESVTSAPGLDNKEITAYLENINKNAAH